MAGKVDDDVDSDATLGRELAGGTGGFTHALSLAGMNVRTTSTAVQVMRDLGHLDLDWKAKRVLLPDALGLGRFPRK